jgi:hypothetical protein
MATENTDDTENTENTEFGEGEDCPWCPERLPLGAHHPSHRLCVLCVLGVPFPMAPIPLPHHPADGAASLLWRIE